MLASLLWIVNSIYSIGYMRGNQEKHQTRFYVCFAIALSAAIGIAFAGDLDRRFRAFDVKTGDVLWETRLGTSVQGHPLSFSIDGKQYIAVTAAVGGTSPRTVPALVTPEIRHPGNGNAVYVFSLGNQ